MKKDDQIVKKIKKIMTKNEPYVAGHGGSINFVSWEPAGGRVLVSLQGACENCAMSTLTLKFGLETALKKEIPEVQEVIAI
jgi:Fe-S cluster biogenesis protein NfuA